MKKTVLIATMMFAALLSRAQWEPDVRLTNNPFSSWMSYNNARNIAASGDSVHVVWYDNRNGASNYEIYYKRSTDGGISWGTDTRLTASLGYSGIPSMAASGTGVHVVWEDQRPGNLDLYYKRSTDGGLTWETEKQLTHDPYDSWDACIAMSDSVLHIVWMDDRDATGPLNYDIYYKRSADGGLNWGPDTRLTNTPSYCGLPCVAASGQVVHVVWEDDRNGGNGDIYYKRSEDGGISWSADIRLTNDPASSWDPSIAVYGSIVHVIWMDDRNGDYEIYYKRSTDGGLTWGADTRLSNDPNDSEYPSIAASGSMVHAVWEDNRDGNYNIYYKKSIDAGLSWGPDTRLTFATDTSMSAHIALSDSVVHVAWEDHRDGNYEIYYKRNPTGNILVGIGNDSEACSGQQISIYPNPAANFIYVDLKNNSDQTEILSIRNLLGEELLSRPVHCGKTSIDVSSLQNGIYFAGIKSGKKQTAGAKLIILK